MSRDARTEAPTAFTAARGWNAIGLAALGFGALHCGFAQDVGAPGDFGAEGAGGGGPGAETTGSGGGGDGAVATRAAGPPQDGRAGTASSCDTPLPMTYFMSADDSNSMASPAHARELLRAGEAPSPASIRTYEFLNYYNVTFPSQNTGKLTVTTQVAPGVLPGEYFLVVGVQAPPAAAPPPMSVTLVADTSGSMTGESMGRAKAAMKAIAARLRDGDVVSLVTWQAEAGVRLDGLVVGADTRPELADAIDQLVPDGASDLAAGLETGYALATAHKRPDGLNRLVLVSDGGAGTATVDRQAIAEYASDADLRGIYLVGVATGPAHGYNDALMDFVTDAGRGAYVYADSEAEAKHVFEDRFEEVMDVAARDVRLELDLPDHVAIRQFYGEGYSENPADIVPQHLAPGDSMVFSQVVATGCGPAGAGEVTARATWVDPATGAADGTEATSTWTDLAKAASAPQLQKARAIVAYAEALKSLDAARLHEAQKLIVEVNLELADPDLSEIDALIQLHPGLQ